MKHFVSVSENNEYIHPKNVQTIDLVDTSCNLCLDYVSIFTKHKFIKLWKIYCIEPHVVLQIVDNFDLFPLLQEIVINYRLCSTIDRYGVIKEGICDDIYHKLKWNKNKMDCCILFCLKMKKYLTKDITRMICNFVLYENPCPKDWKYKPPYEVLVTPEEIMDIDAIDYGIIFAKSTLSILTTNKGHRGKKFQKSVEEEIVKLRKKRRKVTKEIYFK